MVLHLYHVLRYNICTLCFWKESVGYSAIYLENHKCKICEATKRNVVEPVAVFVPEGEENLKSELEELNFQQLEERLKKHYQNIKGKTQTKTPDTNSYTYQTCIFHCEKENKIWMENYNDGYEEYAKRRDKAIQKGKYFNEEFAIKWNEGLVEEFWRRVRAYRFAVDYKEKWDEFEGTEEERWEQLKRQLSKETQEEIEKDLIVFNLKNSKIDKILYDFGDFIFPKFQEYDRSNLRQEEDFYIIQETSNFFYSHEKLNFHYGADFRKSRFCGKAYFVEFQFHDRANFRSSQFHDEADFWSSQFHDEADFWSSQFHGKAYFRESQFHGEADFGFSQFHGRADFGSSQFRGRVDFRFSQFHGEADFRFSQFHGNASFGLSQFNGEANFELSQFHGRADFGSSQFRGNASFGLSQFNGEAYFRSSQFHGGAYFRSSQFHGEAYFGSSQFHGEANFNLEGKNIIFNLSGVILSENSEIEVRDLKTCRLILDNINNTSKNFFFYDTEIIPLEDYRKYAEENNIGIDERALKEVANSPNLEIVNSHLNQMKFINCDFSKAKHIKIESSDLTEVKFLATDWGDISEKRICSDLFKENPKKARDVYRQLKLTLDNHKDYFSANGFYALEMKAQEKILEETLGYKKEKDDIFQDVKILGKLLLILGKLLLQYRKVPKEKHELLVLKIHKLSSDFGQSWMRPLGWIILVALIFTVIKYLHTINFPYTILPDKVAKLFDLVAAFLNEFAKSLIPFFAHKRGVHGLEFVSLLFSIITAFLLYQFIMALRRKVKR